MALFLLFRIGADRYALDSAEVAEVLPLGPVKQIPARRWVCGLMTRHGQPVPVIDITALATGTPAAARTSTRTALVHYRRARLRRARLLGLRLEHATETLRCDPASFIDGGIDPTRPLPWTGAPRSAWPDPVGTCRRAAARRRPRHAVSRTVPGMTDAPTRPP
jgi:chemotaxis-related protein WspB